MIHICICDDSDAMRDELCGLIQGLCQKHSIAASVSCCSSGEELLFDPDDKNRTTDIFFLDILMNCRQFWADHTRIHTVIITCDGNLIRNPDPFIKKEVHCFNCIIV